MSEDFKKILEQAKLEAADPNYQPKKLQEADIKYTTAGYGNSQGMYYGNDSVNSIYYGTGVISQVYYGNNLVFKK